MRFTCAAHAMARWKSVNCFQFHWFLFLLFDGDDGPSLSVVFNGRRVKDYPHPSRHFDFQIISDGKKKRNDLWVGECAHFPVAKGTANESTFHNWKMTFIKKFIAADLINLERPFNFQCVAEYCVYWQLEFQGFLTNILADMNFFYQLLHSNHCLLINLNFYISASNQSIRVKLWREVGHIFNYFRK